MSKRKNRQQKRRQVRRILNSTGDTIKQIGTRMVMRIGYGCGLSRKDVRGELSNGRKFADNDAEFFY